MLRKFIIFIAIVAIFSPSFVFGSGYLTSPLTNYFVRSLFDHDISDFTDNSNFIRFAGLQWTDDSASLENCTEGIGGNGNCYDSHNGVDLSANIGTNVLASGDGPVSNYFDLCGGFTTRI